MKFNHSSKKTIYYQNYTDDIVKSKNQNYQLPDNYQILNNRLINKVVRSLGWGIAKIATFVLPIKYVGKEKLVSFKNKGYFVYANHTQAVLDPILPIGILGRKQYYGIASQANWAVPIIGNLALPTAGLPVGKNLTQTAKLVRIIKKLIKENNHILIFPEAHLWPYYTKIRPFPNTSMDFPVTTGAPSFVMTTTYQQRKHGRYPKITIYIDGPFFPAQTLSKKEQRQKLHEQITQTMQNRSKNSTYNYYLYERKK
ncbi:1-acyl-sn-glycerol-3-phosphate acyltransferase [Lactobacillus rodentium]|uniref:1-acyl-sn-glycerol-3-phosphate acyltransferase n=1 Tax=Lactobacillus rodentium TaxID=947835 RepID=A0A2Z6TB13_9LACO|nr:1-acyl-sn-glycerol-3-phosphate acyltransferase [Lactobacillus rodentium]MCR1894953.1 1-acyl-sn-glycerol-3-phosphate acyltransferase [Lactobacillus rodentium]GBG05203.1 1-acyl-sn-glycerol-3-phosphate acyltransferase [Lactobacillus rodentium]